MKTFLISIQALYAVCLLPWFLIWGLTLMGFANGINWFSIALTIGIGLYPIAAAACSVFAWLLRIKRKRIAIIVNLIPMVWVLLVGVPFVAINL